MWFVLKKVLAAFLLPPGILVVFFCGAGIVLLLKERKRRRFSRGPKRRSGGWLMILGGLVLWGLSMPVVSCLLLGPLERAYGQPSADEAASAEYIVLLGGGILRPSPDYGTYLLGPDARERADFAAELHRQTGLSILVSGGSPDSEAGVPSEAEVAAGYLQRLGVPSGAILREDMSRDTAGNAALTAEKVGDRPFLLVTSAYHMPRSMLRFQDAGTRPIAAPTNYKALKPFLWYNYFFPDVRGLEVSYRALHEYLGLVQAGALW